jgi:hypothetical protein
MRRTIVLAALLALALAAGGVSAATTSPSAGDSPAATDAVQPDRYTVETVDPDDELTAAEVEQARELAWANDTVRAAVDADEPVKFEVWAPLNDDDHTSVQVEQNDRLLVIADVDLDAGDVVGVEEPTVLTADEAVRIETDDAVESTEEGRFTVEVVESSPADEPTRIEADAQRTIAIDSGSITLVDGSAGQ